MTVQFLPLSWSLCQQVEQEGCSTAGWRQNLTQYRPCSRNHWFTGTKGDLSTLYIPQTAGQDVAFEFCLHRLQLLTQRLRDESSIQLIPSAAEAQNLNLNLSRSQKNLSRTQTEPQLSFSSIQLRKLLDSRRAWSCLETGDGPSAVLGPLPAQKGF